MRLSTTIIAVICLLASLVALYECFGTGSGRIPEVLPSDPHQPQDPIH